MPKAEYLFSLCMNSTHFYNITDDAGLISLTCFKCFQSYFNVTISHKNVINIFGNMCIFKFIYFTLHYAIHKTHC